MVTSTKGCIYYKLLIRHPAHPKKHLWDLAVYFEVTPQVQALMSFVDLLLVIFRAEVWMSSASADANES